MWVYFWAQQIKIKHYKTAVQQTEIVKPFNFLSIYTLRQTLAIFFFLIKASLPQKQFILWWNTEYKAVLTSL